MVTALQELFPGEQVQTAEDNHPFGNHAKYIVFPQSEEDIVKILKYAHENSLKVIPVGAGTKRGFGGTEESADLLLSLSRYSGIIEHSVGDLTMTVKPGTTIKEMKDYLAEHKQMLPLDPSWPEYSTIGGVIAANDSGPKRLRYGSARDLVIGLRVVYPDGRVIRTGGKVVKNVAGYDMNKLFIGSMGTLAVISEITLKLRPLPKCESLVLLTFADENLQAVRSFSTQLMDSMMEPVSLELLSPSLNRKLKGKEKYALAIAFEDVENAVRQQVEWVKKNLPAGAELKILREGEANEWWAEFYRLAPHAGHKDDLSRIAIKMGSMNLDVLKLVEKCCQLGKDKGLSVEAHGGVGHGISRAFVTGDEEKLVDFIQQIREYAKDLGGYAIIQHAPLSIRRKVDVWGEKPAYFPLLEGIKKAIDPNQVLSPKRFVGGI